MLRDDRDEALEAAQDRAVDDDGARGRLVGVGGLVGGAVLEVEALRELEVELNGGTLERAT